VLLRAERRVDAAAPPPAVVDVAPRTRVGV
jgi:hypothetical protein